MSIITSSPAAGGIFSVKMSHAPQVSPLALQGLKPFPQSFVNNNVFNYNKEAFSMAIDNFPCGIYALVSLFLPFGAFALA